MTRKSILFSLFTLGVISAQAQTVADFETALPGTDTSYLETFSADDTYKFISGNIEFTGKIQYGGSYLTGFNYSNRTNDSIGDWTNGWSAITASGHNSTNYGIAYMEVTGSNFNETIQDGGPLLNSAAGHPVIGMYVTNTTYAYKWIVDNYVQGNYFDLIVRGYNANTFTDSVVVRLADFTGSALSIVDDWQWVDLYTLGSIDSITFQLISDESFTPFYFAMDDFTTSDGICPEVTNYAVNDLTGNSAKLTWESNYPLGFVSGFEVAVDETDTDAPASGTTIYPVTNPEHIASSLTENTDYVAHIRTICMNGTSAWQKLNFNSGALGITGINRFNVTVYPNPANSILNIQYPSDKISTVTVLSVDGKQVLSLGKTNQVDVSELSNGSYILKVTDTDGNIAQTIISKY